MTHRGRANNGDAGFLGTKDEISCLVLWNTLSDDRNDLDLFRLSVIMGSDRPKKNKSLEQPTIILD